MWCGGGSVRNALEPRASERATMVSSFLGPLHCTAGCSIYPTPRKPSVSRTLLRERHRIETPLPPLRARRREVRRPPCSGCHAGPREGVVRAGGPWEPAGQRGRRFCLVRALTRRGLCRCVPALTLVSQERCVPMFQVWIYNNSS